MVSDLSPQVVVLMLTPTMTKKGTGIRCNSSKVFG